MYVDKDFWKRFRKGDDLVFYEIYKQHADKLYGYGIKVINDPLVIQECIQSIFIYLFDKRETMVIPESLGAYLMSSLKHLLYKKLTQESKFLSMDSDMAGKEVFNLLINSEDTADLTEIKEEQLEMLQSALNTLSPQQREVIYLRYFKEMSIEDTAVAVGISRQTVKNVACTAIARLRKNELLLKLFKDV